MHHILTSEGPGQVISVSTMSNHTILGRAVTTKAPFYRNTINENTVH